MSSSTLEAPTPPTLSSLSSNSPSVIVIGAGWYGLAAAKTYLQFDPTISLAILDANSNVGGVWGTSQIYPGLVADSSAGLFEFSDLSISNELGVDEWADINASTVQTYLERYAQKFGTLQKCRFNTAVSKVERQAGGWKIYIKPQEAGAKETFLCNKLIVATGVTSKPHMLEIDASAFTGKILHSQGLGKHHGCLTSTAVKRVTVVGGNKSAAETVRLCALAGKVVTWLIRKEGRGPGMLFTTRSKEQHRAATGASRWTSVFRPGIYANRNWLHNFLYSGKSRLGKIMIEKFWKFMTRVTVADKQSTDEYRKLLNPETKDAFWPISGVSFLHDNDEKLLQLVDEGSSSTSYLESAADEIVLRLYPKLNDPPFPPRPSITTPWRLFRTMVPTSLAAAHDYSLVFVGFLSNNQVSTHAEISSLWAVAFLEGQLSEDAAKMLNSKERMDMDVATMTTFMARRYLGRKEVPNAAMEIQDYTDLMMRDLGLRTDRKRLNMPKTWFGYEAWKAEWFEPYMPRDYRGVVKEFLQRVGKSTKR